MAVAKLGLDAQLNFKAGGVAAGGTWAEMVNCKDVTFNMEKGEADVTTRGNNGWRAMKAILKEGSVEWEMVNDDTDTGLAAVKNSFLNNAVLGLQILDEDSGEGLQADFEVFGFTRNEPLEEAQTYSVTAKITYSANPPEWIGGA